jgi:hypothetical protein
VANRKARTNKDNQSVAVVATAMTAVLADTTMAVAAVVDTNKAEAEIPTAAAIPMEAVLIIPPCHISIPSLPKSSGSKIGITATSMGATLTTAIPVSPACAHPCE